MKIRIKLANGIEINKEFTAEQLQKAEHTRLFIKANKKGKSGTHFCFYNKYFFKCERCKSVDRCKNNYNQKVENLSNYINYLQTI